MPNTSQLVSRSSSEKRESAVWPLRWHRSRDSDSFRPALVASATLVTRAAGGAGTGATCAADQRSKHARRAPASAIDVQACQPAGASSACAPNAKRSERKTKARAIIARILPALGLLLQHERTPLARPFFPRAADLAAARAFDDFAEPGGTDVAAVRR